MLIALAACLALSAPAADQEASALVSKMLQYYSEAKTLTGTITYTAADEAGTAQLLTTLAYEKPSKLYILQQKGGAQPRRWLVTSDGKKFSYDAPANLQNALTGTLPRLVEPVRQSVMDDATGKLVAMDYNVARIYSVAAATIGDRSVPLDIAIGRREDLQHDVLMWMTVQNNGPVTLNGINAHSIVGKWRPYGDYYVKDPNFPPGRYEMVIADDGRLLRYVVRRYMGDSSLRAHELAETWDVNLELNGKPDESMFRVVP